MGRQQLAGEPAPEAFLELPDQRDPRGGRFTNSVNDAEQGGDLVLEPVCERPVTQPDAVAACAGYHNPLVVPPAGTHVAVTGPWVLDAPHGWQEIHPLEKVEIVPFWVALGLWWPFLVFNAVLAGIFHTKLAAPPPATTVTVSASPTPSSVCWLSPNVRPDGPPIPICWSPR